MKLAKGKKVYGDSYGQTSMAGLEFASGIVDSALKNRLPSILWDAEGTKDLKDLLAGLARTDFAAQNLSELLVETPSLESWRIGEAFVEAYLVDHHTCNFPWPTGRDLKNSKSSPAGTDLVGFQKKGSAVRFAFGEVKTSQQEQWPPSVAVGRYGLKTQVENLRDNKEKIKFQLARYLGKHVSTGCSWESLYKSAVKRFLNDPTDVSLFGILVRDVEPKKEDLESRAKSMAVGCPQKTTIEFKAFYFDKGTIEELPKKIMKYQKKKK